MATAFVGCSVTPVTAAQALPSLALPNAGASPTPVTAPAIKPLDLAQGDIEAFNTIDAAGAQKVDAKYGGIYSAIFGGTDSTAIQQYFQARIHHLIDPATTQVSPATFENDKWLTPSAAAPKTGDSKVVSAEDPKYVLAALNIGTQFWLEGLVNQVSVNFQLADGTVIPMESSRTGVMMLGDGYLPTIKDEKGQDVPLPPAFRQSILVHEARHSDCTGGISEEQLQTIRGVQDAAEFAQKFNPLTCGHLHVICVKNGPVGQAACDSEPFGAYTVGAIYALASYAAAKTDVDRAALKMLFADQISRVQVDVDQLLAGKLGRPDMSHQGYIPAAVPASL